MQCSELAVAALEHRRTAVSEHVHRHVGSVL